MVKEVIDFACIAHCKAKLLCWGTIKFVPVVKRHIMFGVHVQWSTAVGRTKNTVLCEIVSIEL